MMVGKARIFGDEVRSFDKYLICLVVLTYYRTQRKKS
jgi:hypothetical protein